MSSYNEESNACFFAKASNSVNWLWHKRLSHLNFKNINKLAKQNLVDGLPSLTFSKDIARSASKKGKHHRASFKPKRSFSISKCLHLLHMDLFGPVKPQTISHNKYTIVIVDEYSRGRSPDVSYFYVFDCPMFIHNHRDHMGKFDEKADDGFFLGYSLVAKAFRVFNIRRQEMEETYHVTLSKDDEEISQTNTEGDEINLNEKSSFPDDEFLVPRRKPPQCLGNYYFPYVPAFDPVSINNITIPDPITPTVQDINSHDESPKYSIANDHPIHHEPNDFDPA
ncbi:retrovirus-related pol polyprotein from transposon TNT 1-94 [Tanacetum coccineum]